MQIKIELQLSDVSEVGYSKMNLVFIGIHRKGLGNKVNIRTFFLILKHLVISKTLYSETKSGVVHTPTV